MIPFVLNSKINDQNFPGLNGLRFLETFKGECAEIQVVGTSDEVYLLLGLGKGSPDEIRKSYASLSLWCRKKRVEELNLVVFKDAGCFSSEGILFGNYVYDRYKKEKGILLKTLHLLDAKPEEKKQFEKTFSIGTGMNLARDLINGNADEVTPSFLAKQAEELAKAHPNVSVEILDKKAIEKEGMGLFLAVAKGSQVDPVLIILSYKGDPNSSDSTVVVGKGVTYDTGGLNIKPTGSMETMKADMGGAATAFGLMQAVAELNLNCNLKVVVAATENAIGSRSYKPGDVYFAMNGMSVEISNTDAEGRLTLADALTYSVRKLKPTRIINFATLTGAIIVALGEERSGLFSNDPKLEKALIEAGEKSGEKLWPFPMDQGYRDLLKSDIADIVNCKKRYAGSITAACFLKEFVEDVSWAHIDIAGTAYRDSSFYGTTPASGVGVRLMIEMIEAL